MPPCCTRRRGALVLGWTVVLVLFAGVAKAQIAAPQTMPDQPQSDGTSDSLTDKLDSNDGILKPPATGDTEIHVPPKDPSAGTMPVIPPPGAPGGRQDIEPK